MNDAEQEQKTSIAASLRVLISELIDYAGLFPPAGLDMRTAVANYARYVSGADSWALGRFVVPAARLAEFEREWKNVRGQRSWRLTVLLANAAEMEAVAEFAKQHAGDVSVDSVEMRCPDVRVAKALRNVLPVDVAGYAELPITADPDHLLASAAKLGLRAKVRTGGVQAGMFPSAADVARFLASCAEHRVPFKATAGLHHPLRCFRPLTYEPDSPQGTMHGFLNVFIAAVLAWRGSAAGSLEAVLGEEDALAFAFGDDSIRWQNEIVTMEEIVAARREFAISFGSCSLEEPLSDLRGLGLLP